MSEDSDPGPSSLISWASRAAGAVGIVTSVLYMGLILGEGDTTQIPETIIWFLVMLAAGLLAWFADRAKAGSDRKMLMAAAAMFLGLGVLSIFSIGILYLVACLLCVVGLGGIRSSPTIEADQG